MAGGPRVNKRTLEKSKQNRSRSNPQAHALLLLVRIYPDTLQRLEKIARG